jgi:hypothetical protein
LFPVQDSVIAKFGGQTPRLQLGFDAGEVVPISSAEVAGGFQAGWGQAEIVAENAIGLGEGVKALFGSDAREITNGESRRGRSRGFRIAGKIHAEGDDMDFLRRDVEVFAHKRGVILTDGNESFDVLDVGADEIESARLEGFAEGFEEEVFPLESTSDGATQGGLDWGSE